MPPLLGEFFACNDIDVDPGISSSGVMDDDFNGFDDFVAAIVPERLKETDSNLGHHFEAVRNFERVQSGRKLHRESISDTSEMCQNTVYN